MRDIFKNSTKILVADHPEQPNASSITITCERCHKAEVDVTLEWWRVMDEPYNGRFWILDTLETNDLNDRICKKCVDERCAVLESARELEADVPAPWFDPANAGESWDSD